MIVLKLSYHLAALWKKWLYRLLFGKGFHIGKHTTFRRDFRVYLEPGATLSIGQNCFFNHGCSINVLQEVQIGDGCLFGENVKIYDHNHRFSLKNQPIKAQGFSVGEVVIGSHCWLGSNAVILKGVHIGDHCVIGAGAVIDRDIPARTLVTAGRILTMEKIHWKQETERE